MSEIKSADALKKPEQIVEELEDGSLPLDDALGKYEEGIKLSKLCARRLELAKKKVEILMKSDDGSMELKPFDESDISEEKAKSKKRGS